VRPNPSLEQGPPPAWHLAREAFTVIVRFAGQAPCRFRPLSSNVRPQLNHQLVTLEAFAQRAEAFFTRPEQVCRLPFVHSFPKNSCELVSAFLASAIEATYPNFTVRVAKAYSAPQSEWHFWVELEDFILDPTAHQFPEFQGPLVCARPSPLESRFPDIERLSPSAALERFDGIPREVKQSVMAELRRQIAA
jgi:hypothetical protein